MKDIFVGTDFTQLKLNSGFLELVLKKVYTVLLNKNMKDVSTTKILSLLEQILRLVTTISDTDIKVIRSNAQHLLENGLVVGLLSKPKKWKDRAKKMLKGKACFHIIKIDEGVVNMVKDAMMIGYDFYKKMGWVD